MKRLILIALATASSLVFARDRSEALGQAHEEARKRWNDLK